MDPLAVIAAKRAHLARLANQGGAAGEIAAREVMLDWVPRPQGMQLKTLLQLLKEDGISIKGSSFDAIALREPLDFSNAEAVRAAISSMIFIEIKTSNQSRTREGFAGFFFALTESEIAAADVLKERHRVALFNKITNELMLTSIPEILTRAKSMTWQLSVQL